MHRRRFLTAAAALPLVPAVARAAQGPVKIREFYSNDRSFSDFATSNEGERLEVEGFMAPPLKANSRFFVLTKMPMSVCPFCETEAEWPDDILAVYTKRIIDVVPFNVKIFTDGKLELGPYRDPDTGFLSMVRLVESIYYE